MNEHHARRQFRATRAEPPAANAAHRAALRRELESRLGTPPEEPWHNGLLAIAMAGAMACFLAAAIIPSDHRVDFPRPSTGRAEVQNMVPDLRGPRLTGQLLASATNTPAPPFDGAERAAMMREILRESAASVAPASRP